MPVPAPTIWPILHYADADAARRFLLDAFGFRDALTVRGADGAVVHAALRWPEGGAVVLGSAAHAEGCTAACVRGRAPPTW